MSTTIFAITMIVAGYFIGCIHPAYLAFWMAKRVRPQDVGESPGAYATMRRIGFLPGLLVFVFDVAKGIVPVLLAFRWGIPLIWMPAIAVAPVVGHNWPVTHWKGGGWGMAAASGALLALSPLNTVIAYLAGAPLAVLWRGKPGLGMGLVAFPVLLALMSLRHQPLYLILAAAVIMLVTALRRFTAERKAMKQAAESKA
jgi:glycerol-3-phosphate acyltransferase PlsY